MRGACVRIVASKRVARLALTMVISFGVLAAASLPGLAQITGDILGLRGFNPMKIEIRRDGEETVLVKDEGWRLEAPVEDQADPKAVEELLTRLSNLTVADVLSGDSESFGFDPPQASVRLWNAAGDMRELLIGNLRSPVSLYIKAAGSDSVYAVSNVSLSRLGEYPMGFVDRVLVRLEPDGLHRVDIAYAGAETEDGEGGRVEITLERRGGAWVFGDDKAVAFEVDKFVQNARLIQAARQVPEEEAKEAAFYPAPDTARFRLVSGSGEEIVLDVGSVSPNGMHRYLRVSGREEVYATSRFYGDELIRRAKGVNDQLIGIDFDLVNEFLIDFGDYTIRAQQPVNPIMRSALTQQQGITFVHNSSGAWERNRSVAFNMDPLLEAIRGVNAIGVAPDGADPDAFGFGVISDAMKIDFKFKDGSSLLVEVGAAGQGGRYIRTSARNGVFVTTETAVDEVREALAEVRTSLMPFEAERVARLSWIKVDASGEESRFELARGEDGWRRGEASVSAREVDNLINALVGLAADSLIEPPETEEMLGFYPAPGSIRLTVGLDDGSEYTLEVGATVEVGSGWFATKNYYVSVSDLADLMFIREQAMRRVLQPLDALD